MEAIDGHILPSLIVHADWSSDRRKRWMASAIWDAEVYQLISPEAVGDTTTLIQRLVTESGGGNVVIGVDFPIGIPRVYAQLAEIGHFPTALHEFGTGRWDRFYDPATDVSQISLQRPFYPATPGGTKQSHLTAALGIERMSDLLRECDRELREGS